MNEAMKPFHRREFFGRLAQGAVALGGTSVGASGAANPFAYDVSRFSRTDPALVTWEEVSRRTSPIPDARRLAIGPGNVVHVAAGNEIVRWTASDPRPSLDLGARATCVAVAADGGVFGGTRNRILIFDADRRPRPFWESASPKSWFSGIAVGERDVWIADSGLRLVWRCDRAGKLLGRVGERQPERNVPGFVVPSPFLDVCAHPDGLLRINNPGRHRVEAYTAEGDLEQTWGQPSAAIAGFCGCCNPIALAVLADGRTVTGEKGLPRVKIYAEDGTFQAVVAPTESFADNRRRSPEAGDALRAGLDVAVDSRGQIHILDRATSEVRVLRPKARA